MPDYSVTHNCGLTWQQLSTSQPFTPSTPLEWDEALATKQNWWVEMKRYLLTQKRKKQAKMQW